MAQRVIQILIDDLDGSELEAEDAQTVSFSLDGRNYEIDLSNENAEEFREALAQYVGAARKTGGSARVGKRTVAGPTAHQVRDWARSNGYDVPDRGRIPGHIREAFDAAN